MKTIAASSCLMLFCVAAIALPTPPSTQRLSQDPEPAIQHHYVRQLFRCLKLLNNEVDLSTGDHACVPEVFSTPEDVPSSQVADKIVISLAKKSTLVTNTTLHMDFQVSTPLDCLKSVHVRLYKNRLQSILQQLKETDGIGTNCSLQNGVNSTIGIQTDAKEVVIIQRKAITYEDLVSEKQWMDFTVSVEDIKNYILKDKRAMFVFDIETETCPSLSISDIGIETREPGREPVLTLFEKTNPTEEFKKMEAYAKTLKTSESERKRRAFEGSGIDEIDSKPCDLVTHHATLKQFGLDELFGSNGFSMNYCSGHCRRPLGGNPPFHTMVLAKIQEDDLLPTRVPCCVPTSYVSVTSLMHNGMDFVVKTIKNASATSCGCR